MELEQVKYLGNDKVIKSKEFPFEIRVHSRSLIFANINFHESKNFKFREHLFSRTFIFASTLISKIFAKLNLPKSKHFSKNGLKTKEIFQKHHKMALFCKKNRDF